MIPDSSLDVMIPECCTYLDYMRMLRLSPTAEIDQNTTLCLACSCSLPPLKKASSHPSSSSSTSAAAPQIFLTPCCRRPICLGCISANPRLQRYDPCLACLGGVGVVRSGSGADQAVARHTRENGASNNIDGAVREEDTFVLGDADDDEEDDAAPHEPRKSGIAEQPEPLHTALPIPEDPNNSTLTEQSSDTNAVPSKYYLTRNDTLQGIALRFGLNVSNFQPSYNYLLSTT